MLVELWSEEFFNCCRSEMPDEKIVFIARHTRISVGKPVSSNMRSRFCVFHGSSKIIKNKTRMQAPETGIDLIYFHELREARGA